MQASSLAPASAAAGCYLVGLAVATSVGHRVPAASDPDYLIRFPTWVSTYWWAIFLVGGLFVVDAALTWREQGARWSWSGAPIVGTGTACLGLGLITGVASRPVIGANIGGVAGLVLGFPLCLGLLVAAVLLRLKRGRS